MLIIPHYSYKTCEECKEDGNPIFHNCLKCAKGLRFRPDKNPEKNCVVNCTYFYLSPYGDYKCLEKLHCPEESKLIIVEKNQCIDDCRKDEKYKYQYNGQCYQECPEGTSLDNSTFICKEIDINKCTLGKNKAYFNSTDDLTGIKVLVKSYIKEFDYTDNHISLYSNNDYNILIYKNEECISKLELDMPSVDFKDCYNKVKYTYNITEDLVIVIVDKLGQNNPTTLYSFYHPKSGEKLDAENICKNISITVKENLYSLLDDTNPNYDKMISLTGQNINIFDLNDPFYTDLCYEFESPINKDIPLKDRISTFYPNASLCDTGCTIKGINMNDMTSICDCAFLDVANSNTVKDNAILDSVFGQALDIINESNILVMKCYKYIFKYFTRSIGGWLCLALLICQIVLTVIFYSYELIRLQQYIFNLTDSYINYLGKAKRRSSIKINLDNAPPKKVIIKSEKEVNGNKMRTYRDKNKGKKDVIIFRSNTQNKDKINKKDNSKNIKNSKENFLRPNKKIKTRELFMKKSDLKLNLKQSKSKANEISDSDVKSMDKAFKIEPKDANFFNEYLSTPLDDLEYDDAIVKDKRKFIIYFCEVLKERQMIAYTFIAEDPLKTRYTKIMLLILNIILYFVVNGLFFSEDYISEIYNSTKEEKFFTFFTRSIPRFIYCTFVSIIISYITDMFFFEEKKIVSIYKREKDNQIILKGEITKLIKNIKQRYLAFIITVFVILLISFYYLLCFNYVYPYTQIEWVKSSVVIFIIMQILSILSCLLEAGLRILSFKCRSEKMYKISKLLS